MSKNSVEIRIEDELKSSPSSLTNNFEQTSNDEAITNPAFGTERLIIDDFGNRVNAPLQEVDPEDGNGGEYVDIPPLMATNYDQSIDDRLPETVTLLTTPSGSKLYLIGTAHFSLESQNDVAKIIQAVQPHKVIVELCQARLRILLYDENALLEEEKNLSFQTVRASIQQNGLFNGLMYVLMLNMSAQITKELGMAPGGEFRRAFVEAQRVPHCIVGLGDRPINITIQRALRSLSWWQTIKLGWNLMTTSNNFTKEEVERCKRRDFLEDIMAELATTFPALEEVFVKERDIFLTHALQIACEPVKTPHGPMPMRVVGVVGIGHVSGITQHWGKVDKSQIPPILNVPPRPLSSKIISLSIKTSLLGVVIYACYKIIPLPSSLLPQSVKSSVMGLLKASDFRRFLVSMHSVDEYHHAGADIVYVAGNIAGPGLDPDDFESEFSVGCSCQNRRCDSECSCTRGAINYANDCIVENRSEPIMECNPRCACNANCGNRLVQKGPLDCLTVIETKEKGFGLFTSKPILKGQFICEYAGEVIGLEEAKARFEINRKLRQKNYVLVLAEFVGEKKITSCVDPTRFGNIGRYCNHDCTPSAEIIAIRVERLTPRFCLFATRDIRAFEEITFHYAGGLAQSVHSFSETPCACGSPNCQGFLPHQFL